MTRRTRGATALLLAACWIGAAEAAANDADAPNPAVPAASDRLRIEPVGLSIPDDPRPGRSPVIFIPGLWMGPRSWEPMIRALSADPEVAASHQFWTFGYGTNDPIPYSARRLRAAIEEARRRLDPERRDPALDRIVLIGHSLGGLVAKLAAVEGGEPLWRLVSDQPPDQLVGDRDDVALVRDCLLFRARTDIRAVVFVATPHGGGTAGQRFLHDAASRFVAPAGGLLGMYERLVAANPPDYFHPSIRGCLVTSIDELRRDSPLLRAVRDLRPPPGVSLHSIIPTRDGSDGPDAGDGVVALASARLEGVDSEVLVPGGHFCQDSPAVVAEVRRILLEPDGRQAARRLAPATAGPDTGGSNLRIRRDLDKTQGESRRNGLISGEDRPDNRL